MEGFRNLQWYDYMSLLTASFAIVSMFRLSRVIRHRNTLGQEYTTRLRDFLWLTYAFLTAQVVFTVDLVVQDAPWHFSVLLCFAISLVALHATRMSEDTLIT